MSEEPELLDREEWLVEVEKRLERLEADHQKLHDIAVLLQKQSSNLHGPLAGLYQQTETLRRALDAHGRCLQGLAEIAGIELEEGAVTPPRHN